MYDIVYEKTFNVSSVVGLLPALPILNINKAITAIILERIPIVMLFVKEIFV
jgi:hypothetical protein